MSQDDTERVAWPQESWMSAPPPPPRYAVVEFLGSGPAMLAVYERIHRVAPSSVPVLIRGESGTGKELAARAIHRLSPRRDRSFVAVNCATLPDSLLESELFGHARGSFTGAAGARRGLFVEADGGTIFLDEIGDMATDLQAKLLRVLQERTVRPVGADRDREVDVRVIAATHRDLEQHVAAGRFRGDLLYRLDVVPLTLPPLRERAEDIPVLIERFLARARDENPGAVVRALSPPLVAALSRRRWPGNVRELENAVRRIVLLGAEPLADISQLALLPAEGPRPADPIPAPPAASPSPAGRTGPRPDARGLPSLREVEEAHIRAVLAATGGNKAEAARILDIERRTLYRKMERFGMALDAGDD